MTYIIPILTEREIVESLSDYLKNKDKDDLEKKLREARLDLYVLRNGYGNVQARSHLLPACLVTQNMVDMYLKSLSKNKKFLESVGVSALPYNENKNVLENALMLA